MAHACPALNMAHIPLYKIKNCTPCTKANTTLRSVCGNCVCCNTISMQPCTCWGSWPMPCRSWRLGWLMGSYSSSWTSGWGAARRACSCHSCPPAAVTWLIWQAEVWAHMEVFFSGSSLECPYMHQDCASGSRTALVQNAYGMHMGQLGIWVLMEDTVKHTAAHARVSIMGIRHHAELIPCPSKWAIYWISEIYV